MSKKIVTKEERMSKLLLHIESVNIIVNKFIENPQLIEKSKKLNVYTEKRYLSARSIEYWQLRGFSDKESEVLSNSRMPGTYEYYRMMKNMNQEMAIETYMNYWESKPVTLKNLINRWGEEKGKEKWEKYRKIQSEKNTFEYKKTKYGWTKEKFDEFNKSRSVTLEHLITKWGEDVGLEKWNAYCEAQRYTNTKEYFCEKYGDDIGLEKWLDYNKSKALILPNFIKKYGEIEGTERYQSHIKNVVKNNAKIAMFGYSKKANDFFNCLIYNHMYDKVNEIFCECTPNGEKLIFSGDSYYLPDFEYNGKIIEYYGNFWHANPRMYTANHIMKYGPNTSMLAEEKWKYDKIRIDSLLTNEEVKDILIIWEDEHEKDQTACIEKCLDFLL